MNELVAGHKTSGKKLITWNGTDQNKNSLPSGLYIYTIKTGVFTSRKMILIKWSFKKFEKLVFKF